MRKITKRSAAVITAAVVAVGGGAAAWAAWTVNSSATASVSAGTATPVSVTGAALTGVLVPGSAGTGVKFTVSNSNPFAVRVSGATFTDFATTKPGCANNNFLFSGTNFQSFDLPANGGSHEYTWANSIKLKNDPADECQNAPITFSVNVNAASLDS